MNSFYVPRKDPTEGLFNIAHFATQLYGIKQQGDIAERQAGLTEKEIAARNRATDVVEAEAFGRPGQPGRLAIENIKAQTDAQRLDPRQKNWGIGDYTMFGSRLRQVGFDVDKLPFMEELKKVAMDNNVNRGAFAENLAAGWEQGGRDKYVLDLQQNIDDILKKNPNADVSKQVKLLDALQQLPADSVLPTFFPDIVQWDAQQKAANPKGTLPTYDQIIANKVQSGEMTAEEAAKLLHPQTPRLTNMQRKSRTYEQGGQKWTQDYNFNPETSEETPVGKPYLAESAKPDKMDEVDKLELAGIRADKRALESRIRELKKLPNIKSKSGEEFYADAKASIPDLEDELADLKDRENEILGKGKKETPGGGGKQLDEQTAAKILKEAGGDKNKARQIAKKRGYNF